MFEHGLSDQRITDRVHPGLGLQSDSRHPGAMIDREEAHETARACAGLDLASNSSALFVDAKSAGNPVSSTDPTADSKALTTSSNDRLLTCSL